MDELKKFVYFHDWYIDTLTVGDGYRLTLGMKLDDRRATVTFAGTSRCVVEHFGLLNIVYDIKILQPGGALYDKAIAALLRSEHFSKKQGRCIALVAATAGAEIIVEFESLEIATGLKGC